MDFSVNRGESLRLCRDRQGLELLFGEPRHGWLRSLYTFNLDLPFQAS